MRRLSYAGPWLLERTALEELGVVVDELWRRYGPGDEVAADSYSNIKRVRIGRKGAATVTASTVQEAIHLQSQGGDVANSFNVELRTKNDSIELSIDNEVVGGSVLTLSGSSPGTMAAEAMFGALRNWVEDHRAPLWQRVWSWLPPWHWFVWWFGLSMLVSLTPEPNATAIYKEQAATILEDGISSEETEQAIEVLLRMQAGVVEDEIRPTKPPSWVKPYFFLALPACIALSFRPRVVLGVGRGVGYLRRWRLWTRIVGISIPALVFGSFIWPRMEVAIRGLFS